VLEAAAELFVREGYLRTTMRQVAAASGVSVETVYAQGSKQAILLACVDRALAGDDDDRPLAERQPMVDALSQASARGIVHGFSVALAEMAFRASGLLVAFEDAAAADAATARRWAEAEENRRLDYRRMVEAVASLGPLRDELDVTRATDGLWSMLTPRMAHHLITGGWSADQIAEWTTTLTVALLTPNHDGTST
jgi:AcrR family transcriptional regulator